MRPELSLEITRRYVCAICWGNLGARVTEIDGKKEDAVFCYRADRGECDGRGYVTRRYAEGRREKSIGELIEVRHLYPELFPAVEKKSEKQLLSELGF